MRYVYAILIGVLGVGLVVFSLQNLRNVTIEFLTWGATLPLALVVVLTYGAGMITGGSLLALLKNWIRTSGRA